MVNFDPYFSNLNFFTKFIYNRYLFPLLGQISLNLSIDLCLVAKLINFAFKLLMIIYFQDPVELILLFSWTLKLFISFS